MKVVRKNNLGAIVTMNKMYGLYFSRFTDSTRSNKSSRFREKEKV